MLLYMATYIGGYTVRSWHGNEALTAERAPKRIGVSSIPLKPLETPTTAREIIVHPGGISTDIFQFEKA